MVVRRPTEDGAARDPAGRDESRCLSHRISRSEDGSGRARWGHSACPAAELSTGNPLRDAAARRWPGAATRALTVRVIRARPAIRRALSVGCLDRQVPNPGMGEAGPQRPLQGGETLVRGRSSEAGR